MSTRRKVIKHITVALTATVCLPLLGKTLRSQSHLNDLTDLGSPTIRDYGYKAGNYGYYLISKGESYQVLGIKFNEKTKEWELLEK